MDSWAPFLEEDEPHPDPTRRDRSVARARRRLRHRPHRFRHHRSRPPVRAVDRVVRRRRHQERINTLLRAMSVPVLAVVPASLAFIDAPINYAIAVPLGVMGLVLMFGPKA